MKYILIIALLVVGVFGFEIKVNNKIKSINYEYNGDKYVTQTNKYFTNDTNLIISFNKNENELIKEFELKYNLVLIKKLVTGSYIYKSNENILDKLDEILQDDDNIKSIFPLWKSKMQRN